MINDLDEVVHQKTRLGILTILAEVPKAEFNYLRETLSVTAGNLSSHLSLLRRTGYVALEKVFEKNKPKTWVRITKDGRRALQREIEGLKSVIKRNNASIKRASRTSKPTGLSAERA